MAPSLHRSKVLHPLLMVIGFILISGEAILVHRWLPGSRNFKKSVHLCLQGVALASGVFGIWTKFQGKDGVVANFYSLHSWMGLICVSLFGAQGISVVAIGVLNISAELIQCQWNALLLKEEGIGMDEGIVSPNSYIETFSTEGCALLQLLLHLSFSPPLTDPLFSVVRRNVSIFTSPNPLLNRRRFRNPRLGLSASVVAGRDLDVSWFSPPANDDYGGWAFVESPVHKKEGLPTFVLVGAGTSVAVLLTAIAYFSLSRKAYAEKFERVIIPVAVDSTQQEALAAMKKLKIIEDDVKAGELCTRREYARWLVRAYSLLERNPKYRVVPSILLSGSLIDGFDDIGVDDPDFGSIQALAEAGVILSKLSGKNSSSGLDGAKGQGGVYFFPDRFISRQDLINWKAQLNYEFMPGMIEKISTRRVGFMDVRDISSDASPELFMDMLAGDQSILRKVFVVA
ncbi:hypothetical protein L1049_005999 [Liquidambar formosana]|uniref:Cytochrome b561 domain-containing protein n=1 Tax=Liquidambar formosana TaxID=63359 RepID=A0AAP0RH68_LIQFO